MCGGGVAAVEGMLRVRRLVGDAVQLKLVAPNDHFVYRPLAVREPFAFGPPRRFPLERIAADSASEWVRDTLAWVDLDKQLVQTGGGQAVPYDALLIAVGARLAPAFEHATTFTDAEADATYHGIVQDVETGYLRSIAFVVPEGPTWPLPLFELVLMTAERAHSMGIDDLELALVTPEPAPLAAFGLRASVEVADRLANAGTAVYTSATARVPAKGRLLVQPRGVELGPRRIVSLPRITGPAIRGLAAGGGHGFIPIDEHCAVPDAGGRVFAAGDATAFPVKHGGLGAQQADAAAAAIAGLAGAEIEPRPYRPVLQAMLLTGRRPLYLQARLVGGQGFQSEVFDEPPWPADDKIVADELGPYLTGLGAPR